MASGENANGPARRTLTMDASVVAALALAPLVGLTLGGLGAGGSILTLPILVYIAGVPPREAVAMSMVVVGATSLPAAWLHRRKGHFHGRAALLFAASGTAASFLGSQLTHLVSPRWLMLIFAALMGASGVLMLRDRGDAEGGSRCRAVRCLAVGAAVGALTGFLGIGGGFMIVPALVLFAGVDTKKAVGASLAVITANAAAGLVGQMQQTTLDWKLTLGFTALTLAGMFAGLAVAERVPAAKLRAAFAWTVVVLAAAVGATSAFTDALPTGESAPDDAPGRSSRPAGRALSGARLPGP